MKQTVKHFTGLFGTESGPLRSEFIQVERIEDRSKLSDLEIHEHFHSELVQLFFIATGDGMLIIGPERLSLSTPCLIFIPANTRHGFHFDPATTGLVLTLNEHLFIQCLQEIPDILMKLNHVHRFTLDHSSQEYNQVLFWMKHISACIIDVLPFRQMRVSALLKLLFIDVNVCFAPAQSTTTPETGYLQHFQQFQRLLRQTIHGTLPVKRYAEELGISSVHLNRVCQSLVGKSATEIINDLVVKEAKNYLLNTRYRISEIAYLLDFHDPAHFSRFFKQQVGVTPREFRA